MTTTNVFNDLKKAANETVVPRSPLSHLRDHNSVVEAEARAREAKAIRVDPMSNSQYAHVVVVSRKKVVRVELWGRPGSVALRC